MLNAYEQRLMAFYLANAASALHHRDREAAETYVGLLEALHQDPSRRDIAWLLGIDADVMNEDLRVAEVRNWLNHLVIPGMRQ